MIFIVISNFIFVVFTVLLVLFEVALLELFDNRIMLTPNHIGIINVIRLSGQFVCKLTITKVFVVFLSFFVLLTCPRINNNLTSSRFVCIFFVYEIKILVI